MLKKYVLPAFVLGSATLSNAAAQFPVVDTLKTSLENLTTDVSNEITPKAIGVVVAVALLIASRGLVKKFFKI